MVNLTRLKTHGRKALTCLAVLAITLIGLALGLLLGSRTGADIGPFHAELSVTPSMGGDTSVVIPPLGALHLDTHDGPAGLTVRLGSLDQERTQELLDDPAGITRATRTVVDDLFVGVMRVGLRGVGVAVLGAMILAAIVFRDVRRVAWAGGLALALTAGSLASAGLTFRASAIEEPRYEGLLVLAPSVVGDAQRIATRYEEYTAQLQHLVTNVSRLYTTISTLPVYEPDEDTIRVLHVSDLHLNPAAWPVMRTVVEQFDIDMVIDSGDINDWGSNVEANYVTSISLLRVPYVFIRGNHDSSVTEQAVADQPNAIVLDDDVKSVAGLTVAGIGDPRFTPDKETQPHGADSAQQQVGDLLLGTGEQLAQRIREHGAPVDVALVHDPRMAGPLAGLTPLVLAGHTHAREIRGVGTGQPPGDATAEAAPVTTTMMVQGSTGGAGLRGLEGEHPLPLSLSVLYLDSEDRSLVAYDDISVGGTGESEVTLQRHQFTVPTQDGPGAGEGGGTETEPDRTPDPSPTS